MIIVLQDIRCIKKGEDGITIDIIKEAGEEFAKVLSSLFLKNRKKSDALEDLKNAVMVLLYKKGEKENIKNYHPITFLSMIYKIFTKFLTSRLEPAVNSAQSREEAGFRSGFSTAY